MTGCVKQKPRCCHLLPKDSALHNLTLEPYFAGRVWCFDAYGQPRGQACADALRSGQCQGVRPVAEEIETNYRVVRLEFGRFVPSPEAPEAADQCVCVLGGLPYPLGQLSLFWNELVCPRVSSFAASFPFEAATVPRAARSASGRPSHFVKTNDR